MINWQRNHFLSEKNVRDHLIIIHIFHNWNQNIYQLTNNKSCRQSRMLLVWFRETRHTCRATLKRTRTFHRYTASVRHCQPISTSLFCCTNRCTLNQHSQKILWVKWTNKVSHKTTIAIDCWMPSLKNNQPFFTSCISINRFTIGAEMYKTDLSVFKQLMHTNNKPGDPETISCRWKSAWNTSLQRCHDAEYGVIIEQWFC